MRYQKNKTAQVGRTKLLKTLALPVQATSARYTHSGTHLVVGCMDGKVRLWGADYKELPTIETHQGWVQTVCPSMREDFFLSGDSWGTICHHRVADNGFKTVWKKDKAHDGWVRKLALNADETLVASCATDRAVRLWNLKDGSPAREWNNLSADPMCVLFSPDGKSLLVGDQFGKIQQLSLGDGKVLRTLDASALHKLDRIQDVGGVRTLAFSPSGKVLACGGCKPSSGGFVQGASLVIFFDWQSGKEISRALAANDNEGFIHDMGFLNDQELVAVSSGQPGNGKVLFVKTDGKQPAEAISAYPNCHGLAIHPGGKSLAVVATNANSSGNGRVLDKNKSYPGNHSPIHVLEIIS